MTVMDRRVFGLVEKSRARLRTADGVAPANSTAPATNDKLRRRTASERVRGMGESSGREDGREALLPFIDREGRRKGRSERT